jgi:hypothetical protein
LHAAYLLAILFETDIVSSLKLQCFLGADGSPLPGTADSGDHYSFMQMPSMRDDAVMKKTGRPWDGLFIGHEKVQSSA